MATLQQLFDEFRRRIELTESQRSQIASSHVHLRQNNLQPLNYVKESFLTGSYKKKTMIKPADDVDMFLIINYDTNEIKPQSILDKIKRDLQYSYPNSKIRTDKPCVVLGFNHCKFEVTPVIVIKNLYGETYYIPKDNDNWKSTENPRDLEQRLTSKNQSLNNMLIPLIKIMKKMKRNNPSAYNTPSYKMEELAIDGLHSINSYRDGVQKLMKIYEWKNHGQMLAIESYSNQEFYYKCRNEYFGDDFPKTIEYIY